MSSFVRKAFYLDPPESSDPVDWLDWLAADDAKAKADKAAYTKAQEFSDIPDVFLSTQAVKIGGVWRQGLNLGVSGDEDTGFEGVLIAPATQDRHFQARGSRGKSRKGKKRKNRAARREAKRRKLLGG